MTHIDLGLGPPQEPVFDLQYSDGATEQGVLLKFLRRYEGPALPLATWVPAKPRNSPEDGHGEVQPVACTDPSGGKKGKRKAPGDDHREAADPDRGDPIEEEEDAEEGGIGGPRERLQAVNRASQASAPIALRCNCTVSGVLSANLPHAGRFC